MKDPHDTYTEKKNAPKAILSAEGSWWFERGN